jgi:5'-3' exonuclease
MLIGQGSPPNRHQTPRTAGRCDLKAGLPYPQAERLDWSSSQPKKGSVVNSANTTYQRPVLVVDGNSLLHRAYYAWAGTQRRTSDGSPSWAIKGLWDLLAAAILRVDAGGVVVAFDSTTCHRVAQYPEYKEGRPEKDPELRQQLDAAPPHLRRAGFLVLQIEGYEADDLLASAACHNQRIGLPTVLLTSDRDSFSLINDDGPGVRVLRAINGGPDNWPLLTGSRLQILCGVAPSNYRTFASLRGDSSDNLPGVHGIGAKTAASLIAHLELNEISLDSILADHDAGGTQLQKAIGIGMANKFSSTVSRENLTRNLTLMKQVENLPVGHPVELPLEQSAIRQELSRWQLTVDLEVFTGPVPPTSIDADPITYQFTRTPETKPEPELVPTLF